MQKPEWPLELKLTGTVPGEEVTTTNLSLRERGLISHPHYSPAREDRGPDAHKGEIIR